MLSASLDEASNWQFAWRLPNQAGQFTLRNRCIERLTTENAGPKSLNASLATTVLERIGVTDIGRDLHSARLVADRRSVTTSDACR